jgi:membrane-bound metal-dependent hydrolase YbcI (DUF457 family)
MSRNGHFLAALAVGSSSWALDPTLDRALLALGLLALGLLAGASLPDQIEGVIGFDERGKRYSVLTHRALSHWPPLWMVFAIAALWLPAPINMLVSGLFFGALLHLMLDAGSPTGVPLLLWTRNRSFGDRRPRYRPYIYRTGTPEEWRILGPLVSISVAIIATHATAGLALARSAVASRHLF